MKEINPQWRAISIEKYWLISRSKGPVPIFQSIRPALQHNHNLRDFMLRGSKLFNYTLEWPPWPVPDPEIEGQQALPLGIQKMSVDLETANLVYNYNN